MGKAYQCDRCKELKSGDGFKRIKFDSEPFEAFINFELDMQLCPTCYNKIKSFATKKEESNNETC